MAAHGLAEQGFAEQGFAPHGLPAHGLPPVAGLLTGLDIAGGLTGALV
ncbi:hypothetical protein LG297_05170 [Thalassospira australica]